MVAHFMGVLGHFGNELDIGGQTAFDSFLDELLMFGEIVPSGGRAGEGDDELVMGEDDLFVRDSAHECGVFDRGEVDTGEEEVEGVFLGVGDRLLDGGRVRFLDGGRVSLYLLDFDGGFLNDGRGDFDLLDLNDRGRVMYGGRGNLYLLDLGGGRLLNGVRLGEVVFDLDGRECDRLLNDRGGGNLYLIDLNDRGRLLDEGGVIIYLLLLNEGGRDSPCASFIVDGICDTILIVGVSNIGGGDRGGDRGSGREREVSPLRGEEITFLFEGAGDGDESDLKTLTPLWVFGV